MIVLIIIGIWTDPEGICDIAIVQAARRRHVPNICMRIIRIEIKRRQQNVCKQVTYIRLTLLILQCTNILINT